AMADQVAVVDRIHRRRGQKAIEDEPTEILVVLVLVAPPLGDLDEGEELIGAIVCHGPAYSVAFMRRVAALLAAVALTALVGCGGGGAEPGASKEATLVLDFQPNAVHSGIYAAL